MLRYQTLILEGVGDDDNHPVKVVSWAAVEFSKRDPDFQRRYIELTQRGGKLLQKILSYSADGRKEIEEFGDDLLKDGSPYAIYSMNNQQKL